MSAGHDRSPRPTSERSGDLIDLFREHFGRAPQGIAHAPGRVNLIGEHLDYNGGLVMPIALDRSVLVAYRSRNDDLVQVYASGQGFSAFRLGPRTLVDTSDGWSNYVRGVCWMLTEAGYSGAGADLTIASDIPLGAGLSSSAALEVAIAGALREMWRINLDERRLALLCQRAENEFVGVQCGVMDQMASVLAREDHALLLDCRTLDWEHVRLSLRERQFAIVVVDSGQRRRLEESAYNKRRAECEEALRILREAVPERRLEVLADVAEEDLERVALPGVLMCRARHVITEQARVARAVGALRSEDLTTFGAIMNESHTSLRDDFEVSTPELDRLVALAQDVPGVLGARLTGAGFGGCTVNLVGADALEEFAAVVVEGLAAEETSLPVRMLVCKASDGLRIHKL